MTEDFTKLFSWRQTNTGKTQKASNLWQEGPNRVCCILLVYTIITCLGSHYSKVLALTSAFTNGTKLVPYLIISILSYPKILKRISCLLTYFYLMIRVWRFSCLISTLTRFFKLIVQLLPTLIYYTALLLTWFDGRMSQCIIWNPRTIS